MEFISKISKIVGLVTKYALIAVAITKALQVLDEELKKIQNDEPKTIENESK